MLKQQSFDAPACRRSITPRSGLVTVPLNGWRQEGEQPFFLASSVIPIRAVPGCKQVVDDEAWIVKEPVTLPYDPDAGLIVQDPPCFRDRLHIPGYSEE